MASAGLYRMGAPAAYGGLETPPRQMIEAIEAISMADGATGWTLMIGVETVGIAAAAMDPDTAASLLADRPDVVFSGSINPLGRARRCDGGYRVSGRWQWASGSDGADFFWGGCTLLGDDGQPERTRGGHPVAIQAIVPRVDYTVLDTWRSPGLCGSGSHDIEVDDVFVPLEMSTDLHGAGMRVDAPLYRMPPYSRLAFNKVGVATGIARAGSTRSAPSPPRRRRSPRHRCCVNGRRRNSRSWRPRPGCARPVPSCSRRSMRCGTPRSTAATGRTRSGRWCDCPRPTAVPRRSAPWTWCAPLPGISASQPSCPLERASRDVRVVPQHVMVAPSAVLSAGRVLLGLDPGTFVF